MTAYTPLEQALEAWNRKLDLDVPDQRQLAVDDAEALFETGVFSIRHIQAITRLPHTLIYELLSRPEKTGGKFNPEALPLLYDLHLQWAQAHACDKQLLRSIVKAGVSPLMISKLVGIHVNTVYSWAKEK